MKASQTILIGLACALAWPIAELRQNDLVVAQSRDDRTTTGEFIVDPPTLINLGFEWFIQGDDNRNASVAVAYRKPGAAQWASGLPLLRLQGERISANDRMDVISPNMFAGSILDLEPNTAYEVRLTLTDPDGVSGETTKNVTVRTRREPMPHACRPGVSCLSTGILRSQAEPLLRGPDVRIQLHVRGNRLGDCGTSARQAGRHYPRSRRTLQIQPATSTRTIRWSTARSRSMARIT